jgi:quinol monooxygenase YgiN
MVIVSAKILTAPGRRDEFIKAAQECIAATRKEAGCLQYELYASTEDPDRLMYFEQWTSREALDTHIKSAHMVKFAQEKKERGLQIGNSELGIFQVAD